MDLEVVPAQEADIDRLMEIQFSAFEGDAYHEALYPGDHYSPAVRKNAAERTIKEWREDPSLLFMKCIDRKTGLVLGSAKWNLYEKERPEEEWNKDHPVDWCEGRKKEVAENLLGMNAAMRKKIWGGKPNLTLSILCIHKDCQRYGAGTLLVQWGLKLAESKNLPAYLEASADGYYLYKKLGFHQIDTGVVKAEDWDGDYDRHYAVLVKYPEDVSTLPVKGTLPDGTWYKIGPGQRRID